jgi:hypothetical protein
MDAVVRYLYELLMLTNGAALFQAFLLIEELLRFPQNVLQLYLRKTFLGYLLRSKSNLNTLYEKNFK